MTRVALYTRVSTDRQEAENQRRQLRAFVAGHEGWKLVEEYRDEESGATGSRARFQALFEDAHQRKFEVVVFWALDRFSREGTRATINYLHELESDGVGFVSYTERYLDSTGIFRDALIGLLAALANQEGIRLSDRVKAGMARARIEGKHVGRPRLTIERGGKCESSARKTPIGLFGPSRERLRSRTLPPGDCSLSARSHQETERGLGLACVFVPLFLDPLLAEDHQKMGVHITN